MSLAFSRRSFLKYSAVAAVAVAGASLFSGCEPQGDSYNLLQEGAGSMTILQVTATMGTYNETDKSMLPRGDYFHHRDHVPLQGREWP